MQVRRRAARSSAAFARGLLTLGALLATGVAAAQALGYTVQVIAVSDQANALDISRGLLREGFPAYVVRSTGAQGDVYRVRVGAFANRAAAARYAAAMSDISGSRPVPALAEAIPAGIMPLAPRVLWAEAAAGADLRILPWPGGVALRRQPLDALAQATYVVVQDGEVRIVAAWRLAPLAELPPSPAVAVIDVPFVDLVEPAAPAAPTAAAPPAAEREDDAAGDEAEGNEAEAGDEAEGADAVGGAAAAVGSVATSGGAEGAVSAEAPAPPPGPVYADPDPDAVPEAGLLLLRDRPLWPSADLESSDEEVRAAFHAATVALVAGRLGVEPAVVEAAAYVPRGGEVPALVVVEVSDRSGRDLGDVRALGDPSRGLRFDGPPPVASEADADVAVDAPWWPPAVVSPRLRLDAPLAEPAGGDDWTLRADGAFVRIDTADGASWRAMAGALLWTDGRLALVRDGADVVLVDFLPR